MNAGRAGERRRLYEAEICVLPYGPISLEGNELAHRMTFIIVIITLPQATPARHGSVHSLPSYPLTSDPADLLSFGSAAPPYEPGPILTTLSACVKNRRKQQPPCHGQKAQSDHRDRPGTNGLLGFMDRQCGIGRKWNSSPSLRQMSFICIKNWSVCVCVGGVLVPVYI